MSLRVYDTAARAVRDFEPLTPGRVTVYLCGATVQAPPHIGHIRSGVSFDVLVRWLTASGFDVVFCRNVTDIEDKILQRAYQERIPWWAIAERNQRAFNAAYDVLGCLPPLVEPRATGHVPEMVELMQRLIEAGHAYAADGDVYFDVLSWPPYGELSGQRIDEMQPSADSDSTAKRDQRDFALWKSAKPHEPTWPTPWGPGRPGWHLECSAMATKYLGPAFDIHAGGLDLVFPHHENETAQSRAAGDPFAQYWMHNGLVTTSGAKMSKSLGNSLLVSEVVKRVRPAELRYYLATPHYRSPIEFAEEALEEAGAGYRRLEGFVQRAVELVGPGDPPLPRADAVPADFRAAMDDDLGTPQAIAVVHGAVREGNAALAAGDKDAVRARLHDVRTMLAVLALDPLDKQWAGGAGDAVDELRSVVDKLVAALLEQRQDARQRRDFATADAIRDRLRASGVDVEDTPSGPRWTLV